MEICIKLTVFFDGSFWIGVFEKIYDGKYEVSRFVFGSEPRDYDVYDFILRKFYNLKFSRAVHLHDTSETKERKLNSKRLKRKIKQEVEYKGIGTKAQLVMKLQYETGKFQRKKASKQKREIEERKKFYLRQQKKLMKHRGH
ncbi:YjdF family protein [Clostridium sp. Mt-5]|uniref:YjdF family protein n=1 Tax=Clostridium moutaii TaxID=3240932 RepID=A0ABV4BSE9_9CLOT